MNITDSRGNSLFFLYYNAFDDVFLKRFASRLIHKAEGLFIVETLQVLQEFLKTSFKIS